MYQEMKKSSVDGKTTIKNKILALKDQMNDKRVSFTFPIEHKINITPYWLLGFIEGEAWFHVRKQTFTLTFGLGQTFYQKPVIEAIAKYLSCLIPDTMTKLNNSSDFIHINTKEVYKNSKPFIYLSFSPPPKII